MKAFLFVLFAFGFVFAQNKKDDEKIFYEKFNWAVKNHLDKKPINFIITEIGKSFLGAEYAPNTLEKQGNESLVVNLQKFDCTTFLESVLAISRCIKKKLKSFPDFKNELTFIRYRNGKINLYPSRLHYFSDWIKDNEKKGVIKDITESIGGVPISFQPNYMSSHPKFYKQLNDNSGFIEAVKNQEKEISKRQYYYIPADKISEIENTIENGDLIAITTNVKGLDVAHVGYALKKDDGRIYFLHAPLLNSVVQISRKPLPEYIKSIKKDTGIIVLRPQNPLKAE